MIKASEGVVVAPRAGGALVRVSFDGVTMVRMARNHLNVRTPPNSRVLVGMGEKGELMIVGRRR